MTIPAPDCDSRPLIGDDQVFREGAARERRAAARAQRLGNLLQRRPDLAGAHRPADLAAEGVRWSA
jgi:hypothetical protein